MDFMHGIHPALAGPAAICSTCCRARELEPQLRRAGWLAYIRKTDPGRAQISGIVHSVTAKSIIDVNSSHRLNVTGRIKADTFVLLMPRSGARLLVNSFKIAEGDVLAIPSGTGIVASCNAGARILQVLLPVKTTIFARLTKDHALSPGQVIHAARGSACNEMIQRYVNSLLERAPHAEEFVLRIERQPGDGQAGWDSDQTGMPVDPDERIIRQSVEFVEAHLADEISVADLSNIAATSLSKLERTYREKLGMSPTQYIRARRLSAARRDLALNDTPTISVATVANNNGFSHLGRFSAAYRQRFGELPKETLRFSQA